MRCINKAKHKLEAYLYGFNQKTLPYVEGCLLELKVVSHFRTAISACRKDGKIYACTFTIMIATSKY